MRDPHLDRKNNDHLRPFWKILDTVKQTHRHLLSPEELRYYDTFVGLPEHAKFLFVRLFDRNYGENKELRKRKLVNYVHPEDFDSAVECLECVGFLRKITEQNLETALDELTGEELRSACQQLKLSTIGIKQQLIRRIQGANITRQNQSVVFGGSSSLRLFNLVKEFHGGTHMLTTEVIDVFLQMYRLYYVDSYTDINSFKNLYLEGIGRRKYFKYKLHAELPLFESRKAFDRFQEACAEDIFWGDENLPIRKTHESRELLGRIDFALETAKKLVEAAPPKNHQNLQPFQIRYTAEYCWFRLVLRVCDVTPSSIVGASSDRVTQLARDKIYFKQHQLLDCFFKQTLYCQHKALPAAVQMIHIEVELFKSSKNEYWLDKAIGTADMACEMAKQMPNDYMHPAVLDLGKKLKSVVAQCKSVVKLLKSELPDSEAIVVYESAIEKYQSLDLAKNASQSIEEVCIQCGDDVIEASENPADEDAVTIELSDDDDEYEEDDVKVVESAEVKPEKVVQPPRPPPPPPSKGKRKLDKTQTRIFEFMCITPKPGFEMAPKKTDPMVELAGERAIASNRVEFSSNGRRMTVEAAALEHYEKLGYVGWHDEGRSLRMLFGLLFWDIIFDESIPGVFQHHCQQFPLDMFDHGFYAKRKHSIDLRLEEIRDGGKKYIESRIRDIWAAVTFRRWNRSKKALEIDGPLVVGVSNWQAYPLEDVVSIATGLPLEAIITFCNLFCINYAQYHSGLPDLTLIHKERGITELVEVKSKNDTLSDTQRVWIHHFPPGLVSVCRVLNAEQFEKEMARREGLEQKREAREAKLQKQQEAKKQRELKRLESGHRREAARVERELKKLERQRQREEAQQAKKRPKRKRDSSSDDTIESIESLDSNESVKRRRNGEPTTNENIEIES
ncbi:hypothetical protein TRVA0_033S01068 [Trichomonascus vanleenenianus]|uniref:uncharacterized protein n=1 Tax=Trichomonascus vanleenenianus TaxID=2268995 RepID=UPI003ECA636A